ncbi:MAG TPA: trypsin-like serine protease [Planctomycetes bacterium]|nr:trypsin-like serine protease [Planctomycetota bacterium]
MKMNRKPPHQLFSIVLPKALVVQWVFLGGIASLLITNPLIAQEAATLPDSPRVTPIVRVIHKAEPAIVSLFVPVASGQLVSGSGTIIHSAGYVLTNNHVVQNTEGFALIGSDLPGEQRPVRFGVVGRLPEKDLAIVKLLAAGPFPTVPLGRSDDLLNGESVVVAGNPGGRGLVFTSGIVSSRKVLTGTPNALVMTNYANSRRDTMIQFDAASNGGNSGGPLINLEGNLIGVVSAKVFQEQNIGFAIPVDDVHDTIEQILDPEIRARKEVGLVLTQSVSSVVIGRVKQNSAAAAAGLQADDVLTAVNGRPLRHRVDWYLALTFLLREKGPFDVTVRRGEETINAKIRPSGMLPAPAEKVADDTLKPGLRYRFFHGTYSLVPNFDELTPVRIDNVKTVDLSAIRQEREDHFAVELSGYLRIPSDDVYRLVVISDDGSKVSLDGDVVIDHDGNHPPLPAGKLLYLQKGNHALKIEHFEGGGEQELKLLIDKKPVTADMLWHLP